jgi:3-oxosteroid 1-dehydrogenase
MSSDVGRAPRGRRPTGRVFVPRGARESMSDGGINEIRTMSATARRDGLDIRVGHRVQRLVVRGRCGHRREGEHR